MSMLREIKSKFERFCGDSVVENLPLVQEIQFDPWSQEDPHAVERLSLCTTVLSLCPPSLGTMTTGLRATTAEARAPQQEDPPQ